MLAIFLLLVGWGLAAVGIGLLVLFIAAVIDEAWRKISLAVEQKDD
jgi:hypothetical protein